MSMSLALGINLGVVGITLILATFMRENRTGLRAVAVVAVLGLWLRYLVWRVLATCPPTLSSLEGVYYALVLIVEIISVFSIALFYLTTIRISDHSPEADRLERWLRELPAGSLPTVDVYLPTFNEDREILERTIVSAKALDYPHFKIWVLDDGRREWLRELCRQKDVGYLTRPDNAHAKAGNFNAAFPRTTGEFIATFDADFAAYRNFLYRTVGFFLKYPDIAVVQTPQHFFNADVFQFNLGLARSIKDNERAWYDVQLPARDGWGCAYWCGSCSVLRRTAIESVGGIPTESVTEDVLATMAMFRKGYRCLYLNERLSIGLMPEDLRALAIQRRRWARGAVQTLFLKSGPLGPGLSLIRRLLFLQHHYLIDFPIRFLLFLLPLIYLATGLAPFRINSVADMLAFQLPPLLATTALSWNIFRQSRAPIVSAAVNYYLAAKVYPSVVATLFRPFGAPFRVTPKGRPASGDGDHGAFYVIVGLIAASVGCILYGRLNRTTIMETSSYVVATTWAIANLLLLCVMLLCVRPRPRLRGQERFPMQVSGRIHLPGAELPCEVVDLSLTGARITGDFAVAAGSRVDLTLDDVGTIAARVVRYSDRTASLAFNSLEPQVRDRVITTLYASGRSNAPSVVDRIEVLHFLIRRLLFGEA